MGRAGGEGLMAKKRMPLKRRTLYLLATCLDWVAEWSTEQSSRLYEAARPPRRGPLVLPSPLWAQFFEGLDETIRNQADVFVRSLLQPPRKIVINGSPLDPFTSPLKGAADAEND